MSVSLGTEYAGYLGVDMMICRFALLPEFRIHPCVEINLRMNMGLVSRMLYDRMYDPGLAERFVSLIIRLTGKHCRSMMQ